ncbi:cytochrome c [Halopseudomonas sp.]|uniref:c-type cytochrome n=1 Tax=Halopseudomonas sp. TaxID=2901191 RepID=UPI00311D495F
MKSVMTTLLGTALLATSLSAAAMDPEKQIDTRQAGFTYMAWNMGKIKAQVIDGSVEYNQQQVEAAANTIAAIANSGIGALFGPGTEKDIGNVRTRVDPALFENMQDVAQLAGNMGTAANTLAEKAAAGDQSEIRMAFAEVGKTCKACHDKYRLD